MRHPKRDKSQVEPQIRLEEEGDNNDHPKGDKRQMEL
jgi:hypothetical protein